MAVRAPAGVVPVPPGRVAVLNVAGELDRIGLELLRDRCRAELEAGVDALFIDFTGMTGFPSSLFLLLSQTGSSARARGSRLHMIGFSEAVEAILASTRVERHAGELV